MKILRHTILAIALALFIYNCTLLDINAPLVGHSGTALIGILATSCVMLLLFILHIANKIDKKSKA